MTARDLDLDLVGAAALLHRSYDWLCANWRDMVRDQGFPRPFVGEGRNQRPWWRASAIEAWKDRRSGLPLDDALRPDPGPPAGPRPANDPKPRPIAPGARAAKLLAAAGAPR